MSDGTLRDMTEAYAFAVFDKNTDAMLRLYHADVRVFDLWDAWSYEGAAARRDVVENWFGSLGEERVKVTFAEIAADAAGAMGYLTAFVSYEAIAADGAKLREMQNRLSWVLLKQEDVWQIVHEHTSAPVRGADLKASLRRLPGEKGSAAPQ